MTEAAKKAKKKYRDKGKRLTVDFYPSEADLIAHIESQPNKQGYIKNLIRDDMERGGEKYNDLKDRYKKLVETVTIMGNELIAYEERYGDLEE